MMDAKKITLIGLGGSGGKVVDRLVSLVKAGPKLAVVNTDSGELSLSTAQAKLQIGAGSTRGRGTGGDVAAGRQAAEDDREIIASLMSGADLVVVIVGLGGGMGTGAAPVVLELARAAGAMTLCFATMPFTFEGEARRCVAEQALPTLCAAAHGLVLVQNDRLMKSVHKTKMPEAFVKADEVLGSGIRGVWRLLTQPGYINIDFPHLRRLMDRGGGVCTFGYGEGRGKTKAKSAVTALLDGPLLAAGDVLGKAKSLLVSITGGPDLALKEISEIMEAISAKTAEGCDVAMGTVVDDAWQSRLGVVALASEEGPVAAAEAPARQAQPKAPAKRSPAKGHPRLEQTKLGFDTGGRGRFYGVEPTILNGQDLDIPTFRRRGISIER